MGRYVFAILITVLLQGHIFALPDTASWQNNISANWLKRQKGSNSSAKSTYSFPYYSLFFLYKSYQFGFSNLDGPTCRFHPSCSQYALQMIAYNPILGFLLTGDRLIRCTPFSDFQYISNPRNGKAMDLPPIPKSK
jgi:uncharacterized protein